ncbi:SF1B family DNA helicase RecD2 [Tannockella kyphosi]|uniref:SF1B family DNA helicase RecD2 n=1 Tax=Tannockella kyphosi TaxID=2899121 RepID=UPI002013BFCB|nr:ATP-dependent RecD-like DNA helicase [Tannockella kyphosi]
MIEFTGKIQSVRFYSEATCYIVCVVKVEDKEIIMTGNIANYTDYDTYVFRGEYTTHPKYGQQFAFSEYEVLATSEKEDLVHFFSSSLFPGIGKIMGQAIVDTLGENCVELIKEDIKVLDSVDSMNDLKAQMIQKVLLEQQNDYEVMRFFMKSGVSVKNIGVIQSFYKEKTLQILENNPYQLIDDIEGIGFKTIDQLAYKVGIAFDDQRRVKALIVHVIKELCFKTGSTYVTLSMIQKELVRFLTAFDFQLMDEYLLELIENGKIVEKQGKYYEYALYDAECTIAKFIGDLVSRNDLYYNDEAPEYLEMLEKQNEIEYAVKQKEAIYAFLQSPAMILTGGPGTGKSTIVKAIIEIYKKLYPNHSVALLAPTGKAAKRLSELTNIEAQTIHRLLKWDLDANKFGMNQKNPISQHVLIIDEASMVDCLLLANLLKASKHVIKILFIGDFHQLPSVSPGNVLHDLMDGIVPTVYLEEIFRQESGSGIVDLCDQIIHQDIRDLSFTKEYKDVHFYPCIGSDVVHNVSFLVEKAMEQGYSMHEIQVLSPMYQGDGGINELNKVLQDVMNPCDDWSASYQVGSRTYRVGDKILQLKNRPDDDVYNGDIGILTQIMKKGEYEVKQDTLVVDFEGRLVTYTSNDFATISHAYCMSIHKSQGSEFKIVILVLLSNHYIMLKRNIVYTAISRAKNHLFLLGEEKSYIRAIHNIHDNARVTTLKEQFEVSCSSSPYDFMD